MRQFAALIRELRAWLYQVPVVRTLLPIHLHLLFGGVSVLFLRKLLYELVSFSGYDTLHNLFYDFPLDLLAYYAFFVGFWLTLISRDIKWLPYAMWMYAFVTLFPFESLGLAHYVRAAIYVVAGLSLSRYAASSYNSHEKRTSIY